MENNADFGVFDPDSLVTVFKLQPYGLTLDPRLDIPSKGEEAVLKSDEFHRYQRAVTHEKAHYYTFMGSTFYTRRLLGQLELAFELTRPEFSHLIPYSTCPSLPPELHGWVLEFVKDELYFDLVAEGRKVKDDSSIGWPTKNVDGRAFFDEWGWSHSELDEVMQNPCYKQASALRLMEGIGRMSEYIYNSEILTQDPWAPHESFHRIETQMLTEEQVGEEIEYELADFANDSDKYFSAFRYLRSFFPSVPLTKLVVLMPVLADMALSPPVRTDGVWPTIPCKEFSLRECLPQTRFEALCRGLSGDTSICDATREQLSNRLCVEFARLGWQDPAVSQTLSHQRLIDPQKNDWFHKTIMATASPMRDGDSLHQRVNQRDATAEQSVQLYVDLRANQFESMGKYAQQKSQHLLFNVPPVFSKTITDHTLQPVFVYDYGGKPIRWNCLMPILLAKGHTGRMRSALTGGLRTCPFQWLPESDFCRMVLKQRHERDGTACLCNGGNSICEECAFVRGMRM